MRKRAGVSANALSASLGAPGSGFSFGWENAEKLTAFARLAAYYQLSVVTVEYVFDNGQSETGAAGFAVAVITYTVEPFSNAGDITVWYANTSVLDA